MALRPATPEEMNTLKGSQSPVTSQETFHPTYSKLRVQGTSTGQQQSALPPEKSFGEKVSNTIQTIFPGKQVGQAIGTAAGGLYTKAKDLLTGSKDYENYDLSAPKPLQVAGDIAQGALTLGTGGIATPTNAVSKIAGVGSKALSKIAIPTAKTLGKRLLQNTAIGAGFGGTGAIAEGKDLKGIATDTAIGAGAGLGLGLVGEGIGALPTLVNKIIPPTVKENVARVLKNTGAKSLSQAGSSKQLDDAVSAFETIHKNSPNIIVKDINDIEKVFNPKEANFFELPQALKQTKDAVYKEYSNIAKQAGDSGLLIGKKEFTTLNNVLKKYEGKGYTPAFSTKAKQFQEALSRFKGKATPEEIQSLIEQVNLDVNPLSDKAGTQVANDFSSELRKMLDTKLESNGNPLYQATRDKYAQLKSVEKDVIARYKEILRKSNANPNIIDGIASLDAIMGIIKMEPTNIIRGGVIEALKKGFTYLRDPEVNLRRAFKLLESNPQLRNAQTSLATKIPSATANIVAKNPIPKTLPRPKAKSILPPIVRSKAKIPFPKTPAKLEIKSK